MTTRADLRPGMVVEVRQRYVVGTKRYRPADHEHADPRPGRAGNRKLYPTGEPAELVIVRGRWRVSRHAMLGLPYWVAAEQTPPGMSTWDTDWATFDTHAEAIAYADRQARRPL